MKGTIHIGRIPAALLRRRNPEHFQTQLRWKGKQNQKHKYRRTVKHKPHWRGL